jgi:predicted dehydrogenase
VYIVLPNGMHAEYTVRGFQAGKHILSEKPMASTVAECEQMIAASKAANRKLMVAYRCQYEPHNLKAVELARSGAIGRIKTIVADHGFSIGDPAQWRCNKKLAGGGSMMDIGIYSLQAARYITGEEPIEIAAQWYTTPDDPRFKEIEENVNFLLRFPSGILANCTSSYGYANGNRYRVFGGTGIIDLEPATSYGGIRLLVGMGRRPELQDIPDSPQFAVEMDHFSNCILNNTDPKTPGEEGLRDIRLIQTIYEAARTGKVIRV